MKCNHKWALKGRERQEISVGFFVQEKVGKIAKISARGADKRQSEADTTAEMAKDSSRMP